MTRIRSSLSWRFLLTILVYTVRPSLFNMDHFKSHQQLRMKDVSLSMAQVLVNLHATNPSPKQQGTFKPSNSSSISSSAPPFDVSQATTVAAVPNPTHSTRGCNRRAARHPAAENHDSRNPILNTPKKGPSQKEISPSNHQSHSIYSFGITSSNFPEWSML